MAEVLTGPNLQPSVNPEQRVDGSLSYRERLRRGLGRMAEGAMSLIDLGAGIALAHDDLRLTRRAMEHIDEPYDGILERQAGADTVSMGLESDIILDFRRDAQGVGFTDLDEMPTEQRFEIAHDATSGRAQDIAQELAAHHPEWTQEEIASATATRVNDLTTLLGMNSEERDAYLSAQLEYHELRSAVPEIQSELSELRAERTDRLSRIGGTALRGVVSFAGHVRNAPNALSARAMVAGMALGDRIHGMAPEKRRKAFLGTAAGVAIAGIAGYIAMRSGAGHPGGSGYTLASSSTPLLPDHVGSPTNLPNHVGTFSVPSVDHLGSTSLPSHAGGANVLPTHVGTPSATSINHVGSSVTPNHVGTASPNHLGTPNSTPTPNHVGTTGGASTPNHTGSPAVTPNHVGGTGESLASVKTSSELFSGNGVVEKWPTTITVSHWDPRDLDGSLSGISKQLLVRSGVPHPEQGQINDLVDALRPQAQPNGFLLYGQKLDLQPATSLLGDMLRK